MFARLWLFAGLPQEEERHAWKQASRGYTSVRRTIGWVTAGISCSHTNFSLSKSLQTLAASTAGGSPLDIQRADAPALCVIRTLLLPDWSSFSTWHKPVSCIQIESSQVQVYVQHKIFLRILVQHRLQCLGPITSTSSLSSNTSHICILATVFAVHNCTALTQW